MSSAINSDVFNFGSLTQDDKGRMKLSSKIDGFDLENFITVLKDMQKKTIQPYQDKIDITQQKKIPSIRDLEEKVTAVKNALSPFVDSFKKDNLNIFKSYTTQLSTSDNSDPHLSLSLDVNQTAIVNQSFTISITQLAQNASLTSEVLTTIDQPLNHQGTLTLNDASIQIEFSDSILDIVAKINNTSGVSASLIRAGDQQFYLSLSGKEQGIPISYDDGGSGIIAALSLPYDPQNVSSNMNLVAQFILNGVPLTNNSNDLQGIIEGVELHLLQADVNRTLTFTVTNNMQSATNQVHLFADAYNALVDTLEIHNQCEVKDKIFKPKENAYLYGDPILKDINNLFSALSFSQAFGPIRGLSDIGITVNKFDSSKGKIDKHMIIDDTMLKMALQANDVEKILGTTYQASSNISVYGLPKNMDQGNFSIYVYGGSAVFTDTLGNSTYLDIVNGMVQGTGVLDGLALFIPDSNAQNLSFVFNKGIAVKIKEKLDQALTTKHYDKDKTPFNVALKKLEYQDKITEKKIDNIKQMFKRKIDNIESKMKRIYDMRIKTQRIKKNLQVFMEKDKK